MRIKKALIMPYFGTLPPYFNLWLSSCSYNKSIDYIVSTFDIKAPNCRATILHDGLLIYQNGKIIKIINRRPWHNQH